MNTSDADKLQFKIEQLQLAMTNLNNAIIQVAKSQEQLGGTLRASHNAAQA